LQAIAAAALGLAAAEHRLSLGLLLGLVAALSMLWDVSWAAANASPGILLGPDDQFAAGGLSGLLGGVNSIAGYAAGGALILVLGAGGGMYLYGALLLVATGFALPLRIVPPGRSGESYFASFRNGWSRLAAGVGRPLLQLGAVDALQGFFSAGPVLLLALVAVRAFGNSAFDYAVLFVAYVVGGVVASVVFAQRNPRGRVGALLVASLVGSGLAVAAVGLADASLASASAVWFVVGFAQGAYLDAKYAFLRGSVDPGQLGRVVSNLYLFPGVTSTVGVAVLGVLATRLPTAAFGTDVGVGLLAAGLLGLALPAVRRLRY
ncbi:MAG TPA: hypothetical protein VMH49_02060, partial [Thermoplasmata archaeon]|nr:hypothetical protein [Thermoplasmata archaeon]